MPVKRPTFLMLLLLALAHPSADAAEPAIYQVELLLFTHEGGASADGSPAQPLPGTLEAQQLSADPQDRYFKALPATELALATAKSILQNSPSYEVLTHVAWRQPGLDEGAAKAVRIHGGSEYRPSFGAFEGDYDNPGSYAGAQDAESVEQLDGTVKVVLNRYLHVFTDLVLRKPISTQTFGEDRLYEFRIQNHRRMRSKELHYIDHPLLGVLVQITPVEPTGAQDAGGAKREGGPARQNAGARAPTDQPPARDGQNVE